jgi:tetratricopeptide (TPR) repeat protein
MKYKQKNILKTLAILILVLALSSLVFIVAGPPVLQKTIQKSQEDGESYKAAIQSLRLVKLFPWTEQARQAIYQLFQTMEQQESRIMIGPNSIMYNHAPSSTIPANLHETIIHEAYRVAKAQPNPLWDYNIHEDIADLTTSLGNPEQAIQDYTYALDNFIKRDMDFRAFEILLKLYDIYVSQKNLQEATSALEKASNLANVSLIQKAQLTAREGMLALELGDHETARSLFISAQEETQAGIQQLPEEQSDMKRFVIPQEQEGYKLAEKGLHTLDAFQYPDDFTVLEGTIQANGQPVEDVIVFLVSPGDDRVIGSHREAMSSYLYARTNADGYYRLSGFTPGTYFCMLAFEPRQLQGIGAFSLPQTINIEGEKPVVVDFTLVKRMEINAPTGLVSLPYGENISLEWEPIANAVQYGIDIVYFTGPKDAPYQSSVGIEIAQVTENHFTLATDSTQARTPLGVFNEKEVIPASIMGPFHPGAYLTLKISTYDQNNKRITDSEGLVFDRGANYPLWTITDTDNPNLLLKGDTALLAGDSELALQLYAQEMAEGNAQAKTAYEAMSHYLEFFKIL